MTTRRLGSWAVWATALGAAVSVASFGTGSSALAAGVDAGAPCAPPPVCPVHALEAGPPRPLRHLRSRVTLALGSPRHRARDLFQRASEPQILSAKLVYGPAHKDLEDEEVDVWVLRRCVGSWERLGTTRTGATAPNGGAAAEEGRAISPVPAGQELGVGLHRVRFVVAADGTSVDAVAEILRDDARFFVSDVDGTLTTAEGAEVKNLARNVVGGVNVDAPRALSLLAERGYRPLYLSARPDWLAERTRAFLAFHGFPAGAIRITAGSKGALGDEAAAFKRVELERLGRSGLIPSFAFGNQPSDTEAYEGARIERTHRFFLGVTDRHGGRRFERYTDLLPELAKVSCR